MDASADLQGIDSHHAYLLARRIADWWGTYNRDYAQLQLDSPVIRVVSMSTTLGSWHAGRRELCISYEHIVRDPWQAVMATLRHEMAHQYADEVLGARDEVAHGPAFQRACRILCADPAARARMEATAPDADLVEDPAERVMRRVAKLLALGGSPNEHEANSAVQKARALMLEHNLQVVSQDHARGFEMRVIGGVRRRRPAWEARLAGLLPKFFFVEVINCPDYDVATDTEGHSYQVFGTPANLAMAEYVWAYISSILPGLWAQHRAANGIRGDRDRLQFFEGVVVGFRKKLQREESDRLAGEHALVWRGDARLQAFYRWHHPRVRTTYAAARERTAAFGAGQEAGGRVTLRRPLSSESGGFGGLLGG